mgnify:CR=1 FL=1|tara:strand:+ start:228 stop:992 length:765 start_codon:yes stop_codon:yes gene_type:complete
MSKVLIVKSAAAAQSASFAPTVSGGGNAAMQMNLPAGKGVTGYGRIVPALGAAWGALNTLADDSQGDLFSSMGQAGMRGYTGYQAASQALGPAQRSAANLGNAAGELYQGVKDGTIDPRASQQVGVLANRGQVQRFKNQGFEAPKDFDAGMFDGYTNFADSTAGSTSGNIHQNNYEAETGKNADPTLENYGMTSSLENQITQADKEIADAKGGSMQFGEQAQSQASEDLEAIENDAAKTQRDYALKSVRHWSYY